MSTMAQVATTTTTQEIELKPVLRKKLQMKLREYAVLAAQKKQLEAQLKELSVELGDLRNETGEMSISLEGYGTVTLVAGTYKKFNPKKFVSLGGELAVYTAAVEEKPKRAYDKITVPGLSEDINE